VREAVAILHVARALVVEEVDARTGCGEASSINNDPTLLVVQTIGVSLGLLVVVEARWRCSALKQVRCAWELGRNGRAETFCLAASTNLDVTRQPPGRH
jgi:hypothetical protein